MSLRRCDCAGSTLDADRELDAKGKNICIVGLSFCKWNLFSVVSTVSCALVSFDPARAQEMQKFAAVADLEMSDKFMLIRISSAGRKSCSYKSKRKCLGGSVVNGCKISVVSTGLDLLPSAETSERKWLPVAIAAALVLVVAAVLVLVFEHGKNAVVVTPISAAPDAYATSLPISGLRMSESSNLAGGKVTYLDGQIVNQGDRTVAGVTVQVLFRNVANEVAQNETQPIKLIRVREPYVDLEPVSAAPLKPGDAHDFRLIFDAVNPDWNGAYPEVRVIQVEAK